MIMQAIQVIQLIKGIKDLCDSDEQSLGADHVENMVKGLGSEIEESVNSMINDDPSNAFTDLKSFLKG
tara:strand:- start:600 stop:803 length:204 start_codon:yes stop_codon:yes gene_type:complete